uniref:uncharacterized protein LOC117603465 isoform X1 n=1 Tax=Osmia lignaria TaxID=473952 RepID=UPI0014796EDD|nr:uncharacterized protein LOC117603465 isoform X1 [Osmia lignaria]XP_034178552.1 uncharacterized protein LOC117603465 isoform X1 [Osmia lignaria]
MNYGGNMPDWHQYNTSQTNEVAPPTQNVNSGHLAFIPGVNHPTLNALSLSSEGLNKHQNDANFNPRNYQSYNNVSNGPNIPNNSPLASMVQMQNCIGHYGSTSTRNPMLDNINASVDHRNATVAAINDDIGYRTNQVPFNGPIGHLSGPSCNLNSSSGPGPGSGFGPRTNSGPGSNSGTNSGNGTGPNPMFGPGPRHGPVPGPGSGVGSGNLGPRNANIGSVSSGKPGPSSFMSCKGTCCNSDPNINYQQWEKFGPYQNNTSFRDNVHPSGCQMENRHFGNNCNFRKDNLEAKEVMGPVLSNAPAIDHRRNYTDYKYHKDHLVHRNYPASSGMFHNYPVQNYNYSTEHKKYNYPMKEHPKTNNMNISNSGMLKHQEQNFINQQKFNNKQFQYQNGNMLPKGVPTLNVNANMASSPQNPYFNTQFSRNITTEMNHECQETTDSAAIVNRMPSTFMHSSPSQHQVYQHKIAIQKYSMENHLRELSRIPGYQSHPKYKECVHRYREILKLQQSTSYQNPVQQASRVTTAVNASVTPINLQFDQNGLLINTSYIPEGFPKVHHAPNIEQPSENIEKQTKEQTIAIATEKCQQAQQPEQLIIPSQNEHIPSPCVDTFQKQNQFSIYKDFNQNQLKVQTSESDNFNTLNPVKSNETAMMQQQKASKEFANKPELDVRQFLANWDETDDEDASTSNLQDSVLSETTPVVVVSYENVDLSSKTAQGTEAQVQKRTSYCSNETGLDTVKESETNVIAAQDCLTISYSPTDSTEIAKTSKRTIREGVVKPGSIIHCISNGPDEIPTIHIVDNLEISNILGTCNEQVIQTLEKQKTISFFKETSNNETEAMNLEDTDQQDKNETDVLSTSYEGSLNDVTKTTNIEDSDHVQAATVSINNQELRGLSTSTKSNMDLKKQNSFVSEESHNHDDISLPDLPTSECTPISTTLNTPTHSDTEESSEHLEDLSISTHLIEVMQNSPVISFTQLNSEEKSKNESLGTLKLKFRKENSYKANEQEVTLDNFDFSAGNSKVRSVVSAGTNANLSPTESDDETRASRRKKVKTSSVSTSTSHSKIDLCARKRAKETMDLEDKGMNKYSERSLVSKKDTDHSRQSKSSETRRFDDATSSHNEENSLCHITSQYKHYSVAVIKDNVSLSDKRSARSTDRTSGDKSAELQTRTSNDTKEHDSVQFQSSRKSELLQKDLKPVDGDVRYTAEEIRMLKEYRRKKEKLHQAQDKSKHHSHKTVEERSPKNDENSSHPRNKTNELLSVVNLSTKKLDAREETTGHACSKSFRKNADFGIQVANVNLKIKDSDIGKELILEEKGQEQMKDSLEGIKIEINVSCKDQNLKGQEQNKRLLYDDGDLYEIDEPPAYTSNTLDCQCRLHAKEQENDSKTIDKAHRAAEKAVDTAEVPSTSATDTNAGTNLKKRRRSSMGTNEETCVLTSDSKSSHNNASCKDTSIEGTVCPVDDMDTVKLNCAISNTAIVDANNKIKAKSKLEVGDTEKDNNNRSLETMKVQKPATTSHVDTSTATDVLKRHEEKEMASKNAKKLPDNSPEVNAKSLSSLNAIDFNFDYRKYSHVDELDDDYPGKWKKPKIDQIFEDCDMFQSSSGYANPIFSSIDKMEDLNTVPVYTTKDGKISYSPNRRFTYHELMMEARRREACFSGKKSHYAETWNNYYGSKFRKLYKRKRHHPFNERKKHEFKNTKYLYDRKRNYSDEFYGRGQTKYKDYVHSIKNNNADWLDHYKMDKMYSSSDSDEEIVNCNKSRIAEASKRSHETKIESSKSPGNHVTIDALDLECKEKEDTTSDACLSKDKDTSLKDTQPVLPPDDDKGTLVTVTEDQENENVKSTLDECSVLNKSCDLPPEKLESNESENLDEERIEQHDKSKDSIISGNEEENINTADGSSPVKSLNEVSLFTENKQTSVSSTVKEEKNATDIDKEKEETGDDTKVLDDQVSLADDSKNIQIEICRNMQAKPSESLELETDVMDCSSVKELSEFHADSDNVAEQVSQESLESEKYINVSNEIAEESSENIKDKVDEENSVVCEENVLECKEANVHLTEEIVTLIKEREESLNEEIKKSTETLVDENDSNSPKEAENENSEDRKKSESQIDATTDQQNNSEYTLLETVENQKDTIIIPEQLDNEELMLMDFSKETVYNEDDNTAESLVSSNTKEIQITLSNINETPIEEQVTIDDLKDRYNETRLEELQNISVHNSSRNSSVEKEVPVLNEYCTIKNSENNIDRTKEDEDNGKPDHSSFFNPDDSSNHSSESNMDVKAIPKLIIKKTDASNPKSESLSNCLESDNCTERYDAKVLSKTRPKIPKMIIVKNRSRSATPIVELLEKGKSERTHSSEDNDVSINNSDSEQYTLKYNDYTSKVPKVKIKLEDISSKDLKLYLKRKALSKKSVPKVKIKKLKTQDTKAHASVSKFETEDTSETDAIDSNDEENVFHESMISDAESEKIPKLRLKRQDEEKSPDRTKENDSNASKVTPKKSKKTREEDTKHSVKYDNITTNDDELRKKFPQYIVEKIPKVIIKRTQIGTEFKCEISKGKKTSIAETSKWQPKVKLQRLELLDHIVKDLKQSKITLRNIFNTPTRITDSNINDTDNRDSSQGNKVKLSRSNSASNLSTVKCKQRRLSDFDYSKMDMDNRVAGLKSVDSENIGLKRKSKKKLFSQSKQIDPYLNSENENEADEITSENMLRDSFRNLLMDEYNDLMTIRSEFSDFTTEESTPFIGNKFLESDNAQSYNYDTNDNSIIKVESSDESQTTIEILPASPDSCDGETEKNSEFENIDRLHIGDAMPTQLELELELMDNNMQHSDVFNDHASHSRGKCANKKSTKIYFSEFQRSSGNTFNRDMFKQTEQSSENTSSDYFYCNDLLVKEVLAAKEALKKCLARPENQDLENRKSRPKTVAEKKQGLSFDFKGFDESRKSENADCNDGNDNVTIHRKSIILEKKEYLRKNKHLSMEKETASVNSQNESPTASTCGYTNVPESTTISLKASKKIDENSANEISVSTEADVSKLADEPGNAGDVKDLHGEKSECQKPLQCQKDDGSNDAKIKEDNMPLLVPEFSLNFDSSSDRDSSRSPPVITNQEEVDNAAVSEKSIENKVITPIEKIEESKEHSYKDCEMTIADIITELAYHEKATIKHKRYCNLCERWFPTASRHRRHLAGYQHRYMELTQRKSIHALFILFTGKPCPRLLPANVIRNDCSIGELTPLQIAVQDIAKCVEYTQQNLKTKD